MFSGTTEAELIDVIQRNKLQHNLHRNNDGHLLCISWTSSSQLSLLNSFPEVIMIDGTYKVNQLRMPLYTLAIVDSEGHCQPVAHALLAHEDQQHIELFLRDVLHWTIAVESATFVCDKDFAEINAISGVLPDAKIFLCHFHVMKAFTDRMKRLCIIDATSLLTLVQKMLRCGSEETFKTTLETIRNQFPTFHAYLDDNWLPHRALFAGYKRRGVLHLDNHTNNRLERYHHTIKTVVRYTGRLSAAHYQRTVSGHAAQRFQQETEDFVKQFRHQTVRSISVSICRFSHCLCLRGCCKAHRN